MFSYLKALITPYRANLTLEEVGGVPEHEEFIDGLKYSTTGAKLLAYRIKNMYFDDEGLLYGVGVYFKGLYKTPSGRYFEYYYYKDGNKKVIRKKIYRRSTGDASYVFSQPEYKKLVDPLEALNYSEA